MLDGHGPAVQGAVVDAPALHPFQGKAQLLELGLLLLILLHLQIEPGLLFLHVERVVAGVKLSVALVNLHNPVGHLVQKVPVVGDGEDRPLEAVDVCLQPLHTLEVQVVGGLVQEKNLRLLQQEPGQVHPGLLSTREHVKFLLPHGFRNPQAVADLVRVHVHVIAAPGGKAVAQPVVFV